MPVTLRRYDGPIHGFFRWLAEGVRGAPRGRRRRGAPCARGSRDPRRRPRPRAADLDAAARVVADRLAPTPLVPAPALGERVWLKLETLQPTGSFKVRGALAALAPGGRRPGRHRLGGQRGPRRRVGGDRAGRAGDDRRARERLAGEGRGARALPVELVMHGAGYDEAEAHALVAARAPTSPPTTTPTSSRAPRRRAGARRRSTGRSPWSAGRRRRARLRARALGGGAARARGSSRVEAERSPAFSTALAAGAITEVEVEETLADGLAGNLEPGSVTFPLVRDHVAAVVGVDEAAIEDGIRFLARAHGLVAEGAGAVPAAALLRGRGRAGRGGDGAGRLGAQHRAGPVGGGAGTDAAGRSGPIPPLP